jgi:hypothetical protein
MKIRAIFLGILSAFALSGASATFAAPPAAGSLEMISLQKAARGDLSEAYRLAQTQLSDAKDYFAKNPASSQSLKFRNDKFDIISYMDKGHPTTRVYILDNTSNAAVVRGTTFVLQLSNPSVEKIHDTTDFSCMTNVDKNIGVETGGADSGKASRLFADIVACVNSSGNDDRGGRDNR